MTRLPKVRLAIAVAVLSVLVTVVWRLSETVPVPVRFVSPSQTAIDVTVTTTGKVFPKNDFQARANFSGMVELVTVRLGDHVSAGQLLVKMKDPFAQQRVTAAKASLLATEVVDQNIVRGGSQEDLIGIAGDRARAIQERSSASNGLSAIKALEGQGAASQAEVVAAIQRLNAADTTLEAVKERIDHRYSETDIASWKARLADARETLEAQRKMLANTNIKSPIDGTAYLIPVKAYDFVSAGADMLHVADLREVEIRAYFDEPDIGKLHVGQSVAVTWEGRPGEVWRGHVSRPPLAAMTSGTRNVGDCVITVDEHKGGLLPDTNVTVLVTVEEHQHVLTVPRQSLHMDGDVAFVFRIDNGLLVKTPVLVGLVNLTYAEIIKGVTATDRIALSTNDSSDLRDHLRVTSSL